MPADPAQVQKIAGGMDLDRQIFVIGGNPTHAMLP